MKSLKGKRKSIYIVWALSAGAALLLLSSAVNSSRAAFYYNSESYSAGLQLQEIGVVLLENGEEVSKSGVEAEGDKLLAGLSDQEKDGKLHPGKVYEERLGVRNNGAIDEYVRVIVYRYWEDGDGKRVTEASPGLIELGLPGNGWKEDTDARTPERSVYYYTEILPAGETAPDLSDTLTVSVKAATETLETGGGYDGLRCVLEAEVNAVQTHNAKEAVKSAWGVDVSVGKDGSLSFQ